MSCCSQAATYLIQALGGEEVARRTVGGVKWWQVRGIDGYRPSLFQVIPAEFEQRRCTVDHRTKGLAGG